MRESASIRAAGAGSDVLFEWVGFDGDDCFKDFHIEISNGSETERFDFAECAIRGLRTCDRFFRGQLDKVAGGFRVPDVRTYDLTRTEDGFLLQIRLEGTNRSEEFRIKQPTLTFDDELLKEYDADKS